MKREEYRAQVDAVSFSPDFQERTVARLAALAPKKETKAMHVKPIRNALIAAAVAAALCVTALAAAVMLSPRDVARRAGEGALAAAFDSDKAVSVNAVKTVGDYRVTLMGLVSGDGLSYVDGVSQDKTYAVLAYARADGAAIEDNVPELTASPLVGGYAPWQINAWTLGGSVCSFTEEGVLYYLFACDDLEPLADHTVYLAVYPGTHTPPDNQLFAFDEATGAITFQEGVDGALFALPLDPSKADPQAAQALLDWADDDDDPADAGLGVDPALAPSDDAEFQIVRISDDPDHPGEFLIAEN